MKKNRLDKLDIEMQKRTEAARGKYFSWWNQFTNDEIRKIIDGDEVTIKRAMMLGYDGIEKLFNQFDIFTAEENIFLKSCGLVLK